MFTNSVPNCLGRFLLKHYKLVVSTYFEKRKPKNVKKVESNLVQACCATYLDQIWTQKMVIVVLNLILPAERRSKRRKKRGRHFRNLDQVLTPQKAIFGPSFDSTTYISIYTHTEIPYQNAQRRTTLPNVFILSLSCPVGSPTTGSSCFWREEYKVEVSQR